MPNCREHEDCDLVCDYCGDYYCHAQSHIINGEPHMVRWIHHRRPDMPDDIEAYRNERAEEMP